MSLRMLHLSYLHAVALKTLPSTIGALKGLQDLTIADCTFLEELPPSIRQLTSLRQLHLSYLCTIKTLALDHWRASCSQACRS